MKNSTLAICLLFVLLFGWSIFLWDKFNPDTRTDAQKRQDVYDTCVDRATINHNPLEDCNLIQKVP